MKKYRIFSSDGKHFASVEGDRIDFVTTNGPIIVYLKDVVVAVMASEGGYAVAIDD